MSMKRILYFFALLLMLRVISELTSGCAQIMAPTGGTKDTLPPKLINANPTLNKTNFTGNRISLYFDEFVQVQDVQQNLLVSPSPKLNPYIDSKLKSVTIRLRDTLEPNTTYTINLGNSIRDVNESNQLKDFSYVFSTGNTIDSLTFSGKIQLAETGGTDSTMIVLLYKNLSDSAVSKLKPKFISRLNGSGHFTFRNLSAGEYRVYALRDQDGSRTYNNKTEIFAFSDSNIFVNSNTLPVVLFAYAEEKEVPRTIISQEKRLLYTMRARSAKHDVLTDLSLEFNRPLKNIDRQKIQLTDTLNNLIKDVSITTDSTRKTLLIKSKWLQDATYNLILAKDFATDTSGLTLAKADTVRFKTKGENEYGSVKLKFINLQKEKNPVLLFIVNEQVVNSYPLTTDTWTAPLFNPGEYEMRILYDTNKNGKWDPGNFTAKKQPEKVYNISQKLAVKENFERNIDIIIEQ